MVNTFQRTSPLIQYLYCIVSLVIYKGISHKSVYVYSAPVTLWSIVHPASWFYNMFAKESIKRVRKRQILKSKYPYARAAEAVLGSRIWRVRFQKTSDLMTLFTKKSAEINEIFFKVIYQNTHTQARARGYVRV